MVKRLTLIDHIRNANSRGLLNTQRFTANDLILAMEKLGVDYSQKYLTCWPANATGENEAKYSINTRRIAQGVYRII
jgi:hypothetical protein